MDHTKLKLLLLFEALSGGAFIALTMGVFFVYLVSIGAGVEEISFVVGAGALTRLLVYLFLYRYPRFLVSRVKFNFVLQFLLERFLFVLIPLTQDYRLLALIYSGIAATPTNAYINLTIYGSFSEEEIKDVTAKRAALFSTASIVGFSVAMLLLAFAAPETKFVNIYLLGVTIGLVSPLLIGFMDVSHLERMSIPHAIERPDKLFSTSSYFVSILAGFTLLSMVWVPYVMNYLNAPDYLAVAMSLVTTLTSVLASLFFKGFQFRTLRYSIGLDAVTPILILGLPFPLAHVALSAYSSFAYTGSNFVGSFLFAGYNRWLGAIRSSVLTMIILAVAQIIAVGISILMRGDYLILFTIVLAAKMIALVLASTTIPEVAIVPDEMARTYSSMLYDKTVTGYRFSVELSKETIMTTLRLIALAVILLMLYVIYRTLGLVAF